MLSHWAYRASSQVKRPAKTGLEIVLRSGLEVRCITLLSPVVSGEAAGSLSKAYRTVKFYASPAAKPSTNLQPGFCWT